MARLLQLDLASNVGRGGMPELRNGEQKDPKSFRARGVQAETTVYSGTARLPAHHSKQRASGLSKRSGCLVQKPFCTGHMMGIITSPFFAASPYPSTNLASRSPIHLDFHRLQPRKVKSSSLDLLVAIAFLVALFMAPVLVLADCSAKCTDGNTMVVACEGGVSGANGLQELPL